MLGAQKILLYPERGMTLQHWRALALYGGGEYKRVLRHHAPQQPGRALSHQGKKQRAFSVVALCVSYMLHTCLSSFDEKDRLSTLSYFVSVAICFLFGRGKDEKVPSWKRSRVVIIGVRLGFTVKGCNEPIFVEMRPRSVQHAVLNPLNANATVNWEPDKSEVLLLPMPLQPSCSQLCGGEQSSSS